MTYARAKIVRNLTAAYLGLSLLLGMGLFHDELNARAETSAVGKKVRTDQLASEIGARISKVQEFEFIRQEARRLGVRAWLFGGTAAGYAHYVNRDLKRESGDRRIQEDRFDYDYTNIYRSTQDLDIVVDGTPKQAQELQKVLMQRFPHMQGKRSAWEVRLLRESIGDKFAILGNPDFLNQHSDSNSTGLIELTKPPKGESVVRDAREWVSKKPTFLKDVAAGKIHYYHSPKHKTTRFFREGRNPEILSVIRYLTKAFQYELEIDPQARRSIKKIITEFDPKGKDLQNSYVRNWLLTKDYGRKLILNATNVEYAIKTLDELGLREKLIQVEKNIGIPKSLAWWLNKDPLPTRKVGAGKGKTAKELGLDVLAHETESFEAYENITGSHTGDPNVFISRSGVEGEAAIHGNGFYTSVGREGARGTGLTIRFRLAPNAREGSDFVRIPEQGYVVIKNKAAIQVIPESLKLGVVDYVRYVLEGNEFDDSDLAIHEKLRRRVMSKVLDIKDEEMKEIETLIKKSRRPQALKEVIRFMGSAPGGAKDPRFERILLSLMSRKDLDLQYEIVGTSYCGDSKDCKKLLKSLINNLPSEKSVGPELAEYARLKIAKALGNPSMLQSREMISYAIEKADQELLRLIFNEALIKPEASHLDQELIQAIEKADQKVLFNVAINLSNNHRDNPPPMLKTLIEKSDRLAKLFLAESLFLEKISPKLQPFFEQFVNVSDQPVLLSFIRTKFTTGGSDPDRANEFRLIIERIARLESTGLSAEIREMMDRYQRSGVAPELIQSIVRQVSTGPNSSLADVFIKRDLPIDAIKTFQGPSGHLLRMAMYLPVTQVPEFLNQKLGPNPLGSPAGCVIQTLTTKLAR